MKASDRRQLARPGTDGRGTEVQTGFPAKLPRMDGKPVRLEIRRALADRHGAVHAGAFLRERRIAFDAQLAADHTEFARIFVHEIFHFVWLRLGNPRRWSYEALLREELGRHAKGELGWSAAWRKHALRTGDVIQRTHRWRDYACESFCDTAAWIFSGAAQHVEFTLAARFRRQRRDWFQRSGVTDRISI